jgi:DNA mismatch repair protein MSH3
VGIVGQTETAALKQVSANRNTLFTRGLKYLYTSTTYVDELGSADISSEAAHAPALVCIVEDIAGSGPGEGGTGNGTGKGKGKEEKVNVGWVAVCPGTGEVVWDEFEGNLRSSSLCVQ